MPKQALKELERERGNLERVIPPLVNRHGVVGAAQKLEISAATIGKWLKDHGYVSSTIWQKGVTPKEQADIAGAVQRVNDHRRAEGLPSLEDQELLYGQERIADGEGESA